MFDQRRLQDLRQELRHRGDLVAQADEFQVGELARHRGADAAHRVAEVEDKRLRADRLDIRADRQDGRDDAQRVEQPARPAVLAVNLADAVAQRHLPVLVPQLKAPAHLDRDHAEGRAL